MINKLNKKWRILVNKLEKELNKNCEEFGNLYPGGNTGVYHLPIISSFQEKLTDKLFAGMVQDFQLKREDAEPNIKLSRAIGYSMASRAALKSQKEFEKSMRFLIEELKMTLQHHLNHNHNTPGYGHYIKISNFKDEKDYAAFSFTITSNWISMIQLGRSSKDLYLR